MLFLRSCIDVYGLVWWDCVLCVLLVFGLRLLLLWVYWLGGRFAAFMSLLVGRIGLC